MTITPTEANRYVAVNPRAEAEETDRYAHHREPWDVIDNDNDGMWVSSHRSQAEAETWASVLAQGTKDEAMSSFIRPFKALDNSNGGSDFSRVVSDRYGKPSCVEHGAMNKVSPSERGGLWRCLNEGCRAGCAES